MPSHGSWRGHCLTQSINDDGDDDSEPGLRNFEIWFNSNHLWLYWFDVLWCCSRNGLLFHRTHIHTHSHVHSQMHVCAGITNMSTPSGNCMTSCPEDVSVHHRDGMLPTWLISGHTRHCELFICRFVLSGLRLAVWTWKMIQLQTLRVNAFNRIPITKPL